MRLALVSIAIVAPGARSSPAQFGGNANFDQSGTPRRAEQNERGKQTITRDEFPASATSMFVDANVLMNVKADEYVATFAIAQEAPTVEECQTKIDARIAAFVDAIKAMDIPADAIFVDFTAQTKIYGYKIEGTLAREELTGFELKKTVAVRFREGAMLDRLLLAASRQEIYDLAKVDYIVTDLAAVHDRLAEEAAAAIKAKVARHERLLGITLQPSPQVYAERTSAYEPISMYDSYIAGESETVSGGPDRSRITVQSLRKGRTFYYNALPNTGFDRVVNPVVLEPVVQFTLYLKLNYEIAGKQGT